MPRWSLNAAWRTVPDSLPAIPANPADLGDSWFALRAFRELDDLLGVIDWISGARDEKGVLDAYNAAVWKALEARVPWEDVRCYQMFLKEG